MTSEQMRRAALFDSLRVNMIIRVVDRHGFERNPIVKKITNGLLGFLFKSAPPISRDEFIQGTSWAKEIIMMEKTLDNLEVGDEVIDSYGNTKKVLGVCGSVYLMSVTNGHKYCGGAYTAHDLDKHGYKVKAKEEENTELTLEEVAKKFNISVEKLRIKE